MPSICQSCRPFIFHSFHWPRQQGSNHPQCSGYGKSSGVQPLHSYCVGEVPANILAFLETRKINKYSVYLFIYIYILLIITIINYYYYYYYYYHIIISIIIITITWVHCFFPLNPVSVGFGSHPHFSAWDSARCCKEPRRTRPEKWPCFFWKSQKLEVS